MLRNFKYSWWSFNESIFMKVHFQEIGHTFSVDTYLRTFFKA